MFHLFFLPRRIARAVAGIMMACLLAGCHRDPDLAKDALPPPVAAPDPGRPLPTQPPTNDPTVALTRMVAAYKALDSAQIEYESDIEQSDRTGKPVHTHTIHQSTELKFRKRPAALSMVIQDPVGGTQEYHYDGDSLVEYSAKVNLFERRTLRGDLAAACAVVDQKSGQLLSPIVFLHSQAIPIGTGSARMAGAEQVRGRKAHVVKGTYTTAYLADLGSKALHVPATVDRGEFTLWIDQENYLLLKSESAIVWHAVLRTKGKAPAVWQLALHLNERYGKIIQNPTFNDRVFRFIPPKGADETFIERRGQ